MKTWSVEADVGGYTVWEDVNARSADEARRIFERTYGDSKVRGVSEGKSQVAWFKEGVSIQEMFEHIAGGRQ